MNDSQRRLACLKNRDKGDKAFWNRYGLEHANDLRCGHILVTHAVCDPGPAAPLDASPVLTTHEGLVRDRPSPESRAMHTVSAAELFAECVDDDDAQAWIELTERARIMATLLVLGVHHLGQVQANRRAIG